MLTQTTVTFEKDLYVFHILYILTDAGPLVISQLSLQITVTPLGALSPAEVDSQAYFKQWLVDVGECFSSSSL